MRSDEIIAGGSDVFMFEVPAIPATETRWFDLATLVPKSLQFMPLDNIEIVNNCSCLLTVFLNSPNEYYTVVANMIKVISKPYRRIGITNKSAVFATSGIVLHLRRLPKDTAKVARA